MNFLKSYWPALLVTIGSGVAYLLLGPVLITVGVVVAAFLSWIINAFVQTPSKKVLDAESEKASSQVMVRDSILGIVDEVNLFVDEEVEILNESLQQIQGLATHAVTSLTHSMRSLNHQVKAQSKLLHELAGISTDRPVGDGDESISMDQYVDDAQSVINFFLELLDAVAAQRELILEGNAKTSEQINDLDKMAASGASSTEIRLIIGRVRSMVKRQSDVVERSASALKDSNRTEQAMRRMDATREQLMGMRDMVAMNVEAFTEQSSKDVGEAVRSLQFEDIVTQLVAEAQYRLDEMNLLVKALNSRADHIKLMDAGDQSLGSLEIVREVQAEAEERIEKMRNLRQKPVGQSSLDEGSVELF
jgi:methyl-accepting chemotaxis protein